VVARRLFILLATIATLSFASALTHVARAQSTPNSSRVRPLCRSGCIGPSPVTVTPTNTNDSVLANGVLDSMSFKVKNVGTQYHDNYYLTKAFTNLSCPSTSNPWPTGPIAAGKGAPVQHPSPARGKPHFHPGDEDGNKIPGSPHHTYPGD
jgi:hypothetical protein